MAILESAGYQLHAISGEQRCAWDIIGISRARDVVLWSKCKTRNRWPGSVEMETLQEFVALPGPDERQKELLHLGGEIVSTGPT